MSDSTKRPDEAAPEGTPSDHPGSTTRKGESQRPAEPAKPISEENRELRHGEKD
ncbi:hypothetical protein [Frigidibacter oleivorans]|uniref:hypothetical protein n=1 Tax=Frigidibacter oleivorans TaxID=2487129 RepID=UPI0013DEB7F3|nr:hypothetical protein [Frigidibacter oleivorans]